MPRAPIRELMRRARERHVLVPAFNVPYAAMLRPICAAVAAARSFALVQASRMDVQKGDLGSFRALADLYRAEADPEFVSLHQDHVPVIDELDQRVDWRPLVAEALSCGYESVMLDGSRLSLEENIVATRQVVEMAHPAVCVEGELGAVYGLEPGPLPPYEELFRSRRGFTEAADVTRFVAETGCDWLSVAIGSIHGAIYGAAKDRDKAEARLDIERLRQIAAICDRPLVIHGGSGVRQDSLAEAVRFGIAKINVGTEVRHAFERALAAGKGQSAAQEAVQMRVESLLREKFHIAGSADLLAK